MYRESIFPTGPCSGYFNSCVRIPAMTGCLILPDTTELTVLIKLDFPAELGPVRRNRNSGMVPRADCLGTMN